MTLTDKQLSYTLHPMPQSPRALLSFDPRTGALNGTKNSKTRYV